MARPKGRLALFFARWLPHRMWVQAGFLLIWLDLLGFRYHGICSPVLHCYACPMSAFACPIGVVANFSALHLVPLVAIGVLLVLGGLVGSLWCGWACPFGLLQDLAAKASRRTFELPRWSGHFRLVILILAVVLVPYLFGEAHPLFICRICPAGGIEAAVPSVLGQLLSGQNVAWPSPIKIGIVLAFLVAIFFFRRPWCRTLCPLGWILAMLNKISMFFLHLDRDACTDCKACQRLCRYNIEPQKSPNDLRCIRCLECTKCPTGAIQVRMALQIPSLIKPSRPHVNPGKSAGPQ